MLWKLQEEKQYHPPGGYDIKDIKVKTILINIR